MSANFFVKMADDAVHLFITGGIANALDIPADDWLSVSSDYVREAVTRMQEDPTRRLLRLHINSLGGDALEGLAIYDTIRGAVANGITVEASVFGMAASAATLVAFAATRVTMDPSAFLLLHDMRVGAGGTLADMAAAVEFFRAMRQRVIDIYAARSGKPAADVESMLSAERYLTAEQALAEGWIDEIAVAPLANGQPAPQPPAPPSAPSEQKLSTLDKMRAWCHKHGLSFNEPAPEQPSDELRAALEDARAARAELAAERAARAELVAAEQLRQARAELAAERAVRAELVAKEVAKVKEAELAARAEMVAKEVAKAQASSRACPETLLPRPVAHKGIDADLVSTRKTLLTN